MTEERLELTGHLDGIERVSILERMMVKCGLIDCRILNRLWCEVEMIRD